MLGLVLSGVRHRLAGFLAIFVSALLGAALIVLAGSLFETGIRLTAPPQRLTGAPLVVIGHPDYQMLDAHGHPTTDWRPYPERHRFAATAVTAVAATGGVAAAIPVVFLDTAVVRPLGGTPVEVTAQNWSSAALGLAKTRHLPPLTSPDDIAVSPTVAAELGVTDGDRLRIVVGGQQSDYTISAIVGDAAAPETIFFTDQRADFLATPGLVDAIGVLPAPGADLGRLARAVDAAVPGASVLTDDRRGAAENPAVSAARIPTIVIGAVFGGIVLVVLAAVISATVGLSVRQRSREISLLRASGATGRQARRLVVSETTLVGVLASAIGLAAGLPLAHGVFGIMVGLGVVPSALRLHVGLIPCGIALVLTTAVVWLAARLATRPVRQSRVIDVLREAELPRTRLGRARWTLGLMFALGCIGLAVITGTVMTPSVVSATSGPAVLAGSISAALLAPVILRAGLVVLRPVTGIVIGPAGALAEANVRARIGHLATITSCVALVVGIGVGNLAAQSLALTAQQHASIATIRAQATVQAPGGVSPQLIAAISALPQVHNASALVTSGGWIERPHDPSHRDRPWPARGLTATGTAGVLTNPVLAGTLNNLTGDTIAVPAANAHQLGVTVGDNLTFRFGDGTSRQLRVVAIFDDRAGYENLLLPATLLAAHTTSRGIPQLIVDADPGISTNQLRQALAAATAHIPGATISGRQHIKTMLNQGTDIQALINALLVAVTTAYAAIAVVNTLTVSILARRREFALLRLAGGTKHKISHVLATEIAIATASGIGGGLIVSAAAVLPTASVVTESPLAPRPLIILAAILTAVIVTVGPVTTHVIRRAMAHPAVDTLGAGA